MNLKYILEDMKSFSLLEKIIVVVDLILNPKSTTYPITIYDGIYPIDSYPDGHLFTVKFENNKMLYIRWLGKNDTTRMQGRQEY